MFCQQPDAPFHPPHFNPKPYSNINPEYFPENAKNWQIKVVNGVFRVYDDKESLEKFVPLFNFNILKIKVICLNF